MPLGATYLSIVIRSQSLQLKTLFHPTVHLYPHYPVSSMRGRALADSFECACLESKAVNSRYTFDSDLGPSF